MSVGGLGITRAEGYKGLYLGLISFDVESNSVALFPALRKGDTNSLFGGRGFTKDDAPPASGLFPWEI